MTPMQAMDATGRGPIWVARQIGVERTRLYRLLKGERPWTPELRQRFCLALGLAEWAIVWPYVTEDAAA